MPRPPKPTHDPRIEFEPHLRPELFEADASEVRAGHVVAREHSRQTTHHRVDHTVWDEPGLASELSGSPDATRLTYDRWLLANIAETSWAYSWWITLGVVLVAGPWGVLGALIATGTAGGAALGGLILVAVVAPVTEEIAKIAAALWVVEKRPFWFKSTTQILLCAFAGGAMFGFIENLMYLNVYIPSPSSELIAWRWSVRMALHITCSTIAGFGLARIWKHTMQHHTRPQIALGVGWFVQAMICHGVYNASVTLAEVAGWLDLS